MHLVEQIGSGIGRIRGEMERRDLPAPEFKTEGLFTVVFRRVSKKHEEHSDRLVDKLVGRLVLVPRLGKNQRRILEIIKSNSSLSKAEMAEALGISTTAVDNNIRKLREKGLLVRKGGDKNGWWEINGYTP